MTEFRVLVCGGRYYRDKERVFHVLDLLDRAVLGREIVVIHGDAKGADHLGRDWAVERGYKHRAFPADWDQYRKRAGFIRNQQMLDEGQPHLVIAFPGGNGTKMMVGLAKKNGTPVKVIS